LWCGARRSMLLLPSMNCQILSTVIKPLLLCNCPRVTITQAAMGPVQTVYKFDPLLKWSNESKWVDPHRKRCNPVHEPSTLGSTRTYLLHNITRRPGQTRSLPQEHLCLPMGSVAAASDPTAMLLNNPDVASTVMGRLHGSGPGARNDSLCR
jgi:hypothetical protein